MGHFWLAFWCVHYLLAVVFVGSVLRRRREPTAMVAWVFAILTVPVLGMVTYWLFGSNRLHRKVRRRRRRRAHLLSRIKGWAAQQTVPHAEGTEAKLPDDLVPIAQLGSGLADMPAIGGNEVKVLEEAEATYAALEEALRGAQQHIHLEYYIWRADETGRRFRDLLIERAREGVECRLLLDAVGCWGVPRSFLRPLVEAGGRVAFFLPLRPFPLRKRWSLHLRNHRKIAVIDGRTAFLGSQNVGDEYRGRKAALSPWYDVHMSVVGPAALFVQSVFAEDWFFAVREQLDSERYFPEPDRAGDATVQILPTGPDQQMSILSQIMFAAVASAHTSIDIATPYFAPDLAMRMALAHACYRGVRVRVVLPTRSDSKLALWAARSFYAELIDAGVEVYEYEEGVLHSKLVTVDDRWCMLGSANMDVRSFRLNFEVTGLLYDASVALALTGYVDRFCAAGRRVTPREVWRQPLARRIGEGAARLFAPLL